MVNKSFVYASLTEDAERTESSTTSSSVSSLSRSSTSPAMSVFSWLSSASRLGTAGVRANSGYRSGDPATASSRFTACRHQGEGLVRVVVEVRAWASTAWHESLRRPIQPLTEPAGGVLETMRRQAAIARQGMRSHL